MSKTSRAVAALALLLALAGPALAQSVQIVKTGGSSGSSALTFGTTTTSGFGTATILRNNAGVLGEYTISGTGSVAMTASPTFTGTVTAPTLLAGAAAASSVALSASAGSSRAGTDTNTAGADTTIASGTGTGTGAFSQMHFQTPAPVGSGTGAQTLADRLLVNYGGITTSGVGYFIGASAANDLGLFTSSAGTSGVRVRMISNGVMGLLGTSGGILSRLSFAADASSSALVMSGTTLKVRVSDDSADAPLTSSTFAASSTITSTRTTDLGWSVVLGANTACNTTCTSACVVGTDTGTAGFLACTDATADACLCAGAN